jgi:hypothetical protein
MVVDAVRDELVSAKNSLGTGKATGKATGNFVKISENWPLWHQFSGKVGGLRAISLCAGTGN